MSATSIHYRRPPLWYRVRERLEAIDLSPRTRRVAAIAGLTLIGAFWGALVGIAGVAAALLCVSAFACLFCLRDFRVGVVMLVLIMPISQSNVFPREMFGVTGLNPLNLLIATTLFALFMRALGDGTFKHFLPRPVFLLYIVPMVVGAVIGMFDVDKIPTLFRELELIYFKDAAGYVRDMLFKPLLTVVYALLVAAAVERCERPERFLKPVVISIFVMAVLAIAFVAMSGATLTQLSGVYARSFFSAIGMHANDLGRLYATAYALLLFLWDRSQSKPNKTMLMFIMALVAIALMLTFSRGAFTGFIVVNLLYLWARRKTKVVWLAILLVPLAIWLLPGAFVSRLTMGLEGGSANEITAGRAGEIWRPLMAEMLDHPFVGSGLGSIMWSKAMLEGRMLQVGHPHNAYIQVWMDMGLLGSVLLLAFWFFVWRRFRILKGDARVPASLQGFFEGASVGLVAFLVAGFAGSSLMPVPEQAFLWLAVGFMFGMYRRLGLGVRVARR